MKRIDFDVEGPALIELKKFSDARGFFSERFRLDKFEQQGLATGLVQENFSRSKPGVLRGLHYQWEGPQAKLVTVMSGRIFDVAVDIRKGSKTFGKQVCVELSGEEPAWFFIPAGFAHGFCVLGDEPADVLYKVDHYYNAASESGIAYNDPELAVPWPLKNPILSEKDERLQSFAEYVKSPKF